MAMIMEGRTARFIGAKRECEILCAAMREQGVKNLTVEEI